MNCADLLCCQYKIFYLLINVGRWSFTQTDKRAGWRKMLLLGLTWLLIMGKNRILIGNGFIKWKLINKLHCLSTGLCWFIVLSLTSGKKITNEKVFKYQSAGDKTIEIVESAKLPQLAHHLRPIFGLVFNVFKNRAYWWFRYFYLISTLGVYVVDLSFWKSWNNENACKLELTPGQLIYKKYHLNERFLFVNSL